MAGLVFILVLTTAVIFFRYGRCRSIRILVPGKFAGLLHDAGLFANVIPGAYVVQVNWRSPRKCIDYFRVARANIFIERSEIANGFPARKHYLSPNPEFFHVNGLLPDVFLCKTHHGQHVLSTLGKTEFVGHTSDDLYDPTIKKVEDLIVLFAGTSGLKNADKAIEAWHRNPDFPHLTVTCGKYARPDFPDNAQLPPNLTIHEWLDEAELLHNARRAGAFLCPSTTEGFGHYINEGRAVGTLVITTDCPPMNELVDERNGILIPVSDYVDVAEAIPLKSTGFDQDNKIRFPVAVVSVENIEWAIRQYMAMPLAERARRRDFSRQRYLEGKQHWEQSIRALFG